MNHDLYAIDYQLFFCSLTDLLEPFHQQRLVQYADILGVHDGGVLGALHAKTDFIIADLNLFRQ